MGFEGGGSTILEQRSTFSQAFWSDVANQVDLPATAADTDLPDIVISGLPSGLTVTRVVLMLKARAIENTNGTGVNAIDGAQNVVIKEDSEAWALAIPAINLADNMWEVPLSTKESGDILVGDNDVKATVSGNGTYNVRIEDAKVDLAALRLHDLQVGFKVFWEA